MKVSSYCTIPTAITKLRKGEEATIKPRGDSMSPKVKNKDLVTLAPSVHGLRKGDIVLVKVGSRVYLHLIHALDKKNDRYLIGNNKGIINGWVPFENIYGYAIQIDPA